MEDCEKTNEQLVEELETLRQDVDQLKLQEVAYEAQTELLRTLVAMGDVPSPTLALRLLAQQALRICNRLTNAEEGSLFFLDDDGRVIECVLARGAMIKERKDNLIGQVLEKGLAGWVNEKHQVGLITDTMRDERWLQLPNEPYSVRSALCIPILRGKRLLGLITLMHAQPGHFRYEAARLMQTTTTQIGLVVEFVRRYAIAHSNDHSSHLMGETASSAPESESFTAASDAAEHTADVHLIKTLRLHREDTVSDNGKNPISTQPAIETPETSEPDASLDNPSHPIAANLTSSLPLSPFPTTFPQHRRTPPPPPSSLPRSPDPNSPVLRENALSRLGLYIIVWDGKFIYANNHLARIFGYRFDEIISLSTIFALVSDAHYDFVAEKIYQCVRGQIKHLSCRFKGKCKNGKPISVEIYGVRTQFYGKSVMIGVLRALPKPLPNVPKSL